LLKTQSGARALTADPADIVVVYVTAPESEAPRLARALVEREVAACVNIVPQIRSIYTWDGKVEDGTESLLIIKTARARFDALREAVVGLHSYQVPEVIALPVVAASAPYRDWVLRSTTGGAP
jgi:periplasmic divalent cation tolerance protein